MKFQFVSSHRSPTIIVHDAPLPMHLEKVYSSPVREKIPSKRHSMIHEEENPSIYNIDEIFDEIGRASCRERV